MRATTLPWSRRRFLQTQLPLALRHVGLGVGGLALWGCGGAAPGNAAPALAASWPEVPAGGVRVLPTRNTFLSQNPRLAGWQDAFGKVIDDYSGGVFNPYWGALGAMVFHGGGHAATFDNSVVLLDLNDLTFKRVSNPTPPNNGKFWADTTGRANPVDPALDPLRCEYGDGQPGAAHTYDTLAILPPEAGGAACGSLVRVASFAVHVNASCNTGWAHRFDFTDTAMRDGTWVRASTNGPTSYLLPGACSAFDARRQRIWWLSGLTSAPPFIRYLDVATGRQHDLVYAAGAPLAPAADFDSATLRYDALHDRLVLTGTRSGALVLATLRCSAAAQGWRVAAQSAMSARVPVVDNSAVGFDQMRPGGPWLLLSPADRNAVYAVHIPDDPDAPGAVWMVNRQPVDGSGLALARVVGKRWSYCAAVGCFVWLASSTSAVVAYRPVGV